jgi:hypothetical protein
MEKVTSSVAEIWACSLAQPTVSDVKTLDLIASIYVTPTGRP